MLRRNMSHLTCQSLHFINNRVFVLWLLSFRESKGTLTWFGSISRSVASQQQVTNLKKEKKNTLVDQPQEPRIRKKILLTWHLSRPSEQCFPVCHMLIGWHPRWKIVEKVISSLIFSIYFSNYLSVSVYIIRICLWQMHLKLPVAWAQPKFTSCSGHSLWRATNDQPCSYTWGTRTPGYLPLALPSPKFSGLLPAH